MQSLFTDVGWEERRSGRCPKARFGICDVESTDAAQSFDVSLIVCLNTLQFSHSIQLPCWFQRPNSKKSLFPSHLSLLFYHFDHRLSPSLPHSLLQTTMK
jgi:hypothetical protein